MIITIDGPAGSGKSTAARLLAQKLSASFLDTGAMYRAVTLAAMQAGIDLNDQDKLLGIMETSEFQFSVTDDKMLVSINGLDVTEQLRSPQVTANARYIASAPKAREKLVQMQRHFAAGRQKIVTEGRDQGTVAFKDADIKFYLIADPTTRARRRQADLRAKGDDQTLEQIQKAIEERDKSDRNRTVGPLKPAQDAVIIDTTDLSIDGVVEKLLSCVKEKCFEKN
jgi:cytidylate kinase